MSENRKKTIFASRKRKNLIEEGTQSPLFLYRMLSKKVDILLDNAFKKRPDLYLIESSLSPSNDIKIIVDGDKPVSVEDCIFVSREIEHNLDREVLDFSLEVTTPGLSKPFVHHRQYLKNRGRTIEVISQDGTEYKGKLEAVEKDKIYLSWTEKQPKEKGKGKINVEKKVDLYFKEIKLAKTIITF